MTLDLPPEVRAYLPEPDDLFAVPGVVAVHRVPLPVLQVHLLHAAEHHLAQPAAGLKVSLCLSTTHPPTHLQLLLIEVLKPLKRDHLVEAVQEGLGLTFHSAGEPPLRHETAGRRPLTPSSLHPEVPPGWLWPT